MQQGRLFVLSGPSGAGKGTICDRVIKEGSAELSISMTTRALRGKEIDGVSYYFVSDEKFDKTIEEGGFLEYAGIYGHRYGTPKAPVLKAMSEGKDVILEIEMQGAAQVKENYPDAVLVFVLPPSLAELRERLIKRNTDSPEQIIKRTESTLNEIHRIGEYDYYVINGDLDDAVETVKNVIKAVHGDEEAKKAVRKNKVGKRALKMIKKYDEEALQ
jgi:guanylate kinase